MQTIYLNRNLVPHQLKLLGISESAAGHYLRNGLCHTIKLRDLDRSQLSELEKSRPGQNKAICFYRDPAGVNSAIISGSEEELRMLALNLEHHEGNLAHLGRSILITLDRALNLPRSVLQIGNLSFPVGERTLVMGILNVTPDSFSDGGRFNNFDRALEQAYRMAEEGADIIDIGGESTRPGYENEAKVTAREELDRVIPVIERLKKDHSFNLPISIDTYKAETAEIALAAGADLLNDVWGFKEDPAIAAVAARYQVPICLMHNRRSTNYDDLIGDIIRELLESVYLAIEAGVAENKIIIDPGIGFGKDHLQNLDVMLHLREIRDLGYPLLLGTSRKRIVGNTLNLPVEERIEGTGATIAYGISAGADIVRVHDVKEMKRVVTMTDAMIRR